MEYTTLGRSGLHVSRIGLGLAALGRPGYINLGHAEDLQGDYDIKAMQGHTHRMLDLAWQHGVRYLDAARSYGKAEIFLGKWLLDRQKSERDAVVGSKWGYTYTADWQVEAEHHEVKEHSLPVFQQQWEESQMFLSQYLKLYQVHSATLDSGILSNVEVLNAMVEKKAAGMSLGLSLSGPQQAETLRKAMQVEVDGRPVFDTVQATWNLLEPSAGNILAEVNEAGMGVIIKEAVANGRLTDRNSDPAFREKKVYLLQMAEKYSVSLDTLAMAAVLSQPWVHVVLSGAATEAQLLSNLQALQLNVEAEELLDELAESPEVYWQTRKALVWN
ncbi:MAG: aldo/keto reductase [Bacteroidota bacterium]